MKMKYMRKMYYKKIETHQTIKIKKAYTDETTKIFLDSNSRFIFELSPDFLKTNMFDSFELERIQFQIHMENG